jgi:hypothetical protein
METYVNPIPNVDDVEEPNVKKIANNKQKKYTQEEVYFAFLDVLGFKQNFTDNKCDGGNLLAETYDDVFNYYFELMGAANFNLKDENYYAGQTSDSLYFYTYRVDFLLQFIKIFSHFNSYAMSQGIFFRGGIAKGLLFKKEGYQFYGDSVINAYLLESKVSQNPVVYIAENTYDELKALNNEIVLLTEEHKHRHYIKPFNTTEIDLKSLLNEKAVLALKEIEDDLVKKNIDENKKKFEYDPHNFDKYVFLQDSYDSNKKQKESE